MATTSPYDYFQSKLTDISASHLSASNRYFYIDMGFSIVYTILVASSPSAYILSSTVNNTLLAQWSTYNVMLIGALAGIMKHLNASSLKQKHYALYMRCNRLLRELEIRESFADGDVETFIKYTKTEIDELESLMPEYVVST